MGLSAMACNDKVLALFRAWMEVIAAVGEGFRNSLTHLRWNVRLLAVIQTSLVISEVELL